MAFQVILKRTLEKESLERIAREVAEMSGASPEQVANALGTKSISIGKDFSAEKAEELKSRFEALGASAVVKDLSAPAESQVVNKSGDEDDEDEEGVLLTKEEYVKALNTRADLFYSEKDRRLVFIMPFAIIVGFIMGFFLVEMNLAKIAPDFYAKKMKKNSVVLGEDLIIEKKKEKKEEKKKEIKKEKKSLKKSKNKPQKVVKKSGGGGSSRSRVMKSGLFDKMSGPVTASSVTDADPFARGGHAKGIDALIAGGGGLKRGGGGGTGRNTGGGVGFGAGTGSGFGGGGGGVNLKGLSGSSTAARTTVKKRQVKRVSRPRGASNAGMTGGRSKANIMRTVRNNMASLKYAYNRRLKAKPGIKGKITVKWAIDEFGNVLHCRVVKSTMGDPTFEKEVVRKIKAWAFGKINIPGDVTEVTYPFVFTQ